MINLRQQEDKEKHSFVAEAWLRSQDRSISNLKDAFKRKHANVAGMQFVPDFERLYNMHDYVVISTGRRCGKSTFIACAIASLMCKGPGDIYAFSPMKLQSKCLCETVSSILGKGVPEPPGRTSTTLIHEKTGCRAVFKSSTGNVEGGLARDIFFDEYAYMTPTSLRKIMKNFVAKPACNRAFFASTPSDVDANAIIREYLPNIREEVVRAGHEERPY